MRPIAGAALFSIVASLLATSLAHALTVIPPTFEELVANADTVIDGQVTGVRTEKEQHEGRPIPYTYVAIKVLDVLKGHPGASVELRILGGTVDDFTMEVAGVPKFAVGDRNLFFIAGNGSSFCPLVAVPHGYYPIRKRDSDGAEIVLRSNGAPLTGPSDVSQAMEHVPAGTHGASAVEHAMALADFKKQIRAEAAHAKQQ